MKTMKRWFALCCAVVLLMGMVLVSHATTRSLGDYIDTSKLTAAYFFDSNLDAAYGTTTAKAVGEVEYVDGIDGKAVSAPGTAHVSTDLKFSEKSFSIALWINRGDVTGDPSLYGNQNWNNSRFTGFPVPMAAAGSVANLAISNYRSSDDYTRIRMGYTFPAEKLNQWVHTLLVIDRENNVAKWYEDFQYVTETSIASLGTYSLDSELPFTIGHEPTASYKYYADLTFDDLLVFDHAVTTETIGNLKNYYYVPAESVTLNKAAVELQVNQGVALTATAAPNVPLPRETAWSSNNPAVATVDENGVVKAVAPGTAIITATVDGKTASCTVTVTAAPERRIYEHVVVVGIDGAGDFFGAETPNIDRIFANGAYTNKCLVTSPSISAQNWSTCMTGVTPNLHEVTNDTSNATPYTKDEYPTFFKLVRESYPDYMISTFCTWQNIDIGCIENGIGVLKGELQSGGPFARDRYVKEAAVEQIAAESPNLLFLHFNGLDSRGHEFGFGSTKFKEMTVTVDQYVGEIYDAIQANEEMKDNTLFIVTADHGGTCTEDETGGSHGDWSDVEKYVFFGAVGTGINKTNNLQVRLIDTAAIVTYALNARENPVWDSYVPKNLFNDYLNAPYKETLFESVTASTPAKDEATYIDKFVDTEKLDAAIFFDGGKNTDLMGNVTAKNVGTIYYTDGYYGHGVELSCDGYISMDEPAFGAESFSIGLWVKRGKIYGDPALYGNQDWANSRNTGFTFPMKNAGLAANMAFSNLDEAVRIRLETNYEEENYGQWVHTLLVVDRESQKAKYYENFRFMNEVSLESLGDLSLDSGLPFNLGQDGTGEYCNNINANVDDLLVYNCAVTEEDIADLETYYSFRDCHKGEHIEEAISCEGATCTKTGLTAGVKCSVCGKVLVAQEETPALGHDFEILKGEDATCTETGLTEGRDCSRCDVDDIEQEEIPAKGHEWGAYRYNNDATYTKDGTKTRQCSSCKKTQTVTASGTMLQQVDSSKKFKDVAENSWYKSYVDYAITFGIFSGTSANTFSPDLNMSRAQFVQVLASISGIDTSNSMVNSGFRDVPKGQWYTAAVTWAVKNNIVSGVAEGRFAPNDHVTREQMCVMLVSYVERYRGESLATVIDAPTFADDKEISGWAKAAVYKCADAKLVNGVGKNKFAPKNTATRAQGATIFSGFHKEYIK